MSSAVPSIRFLAPRQLRLPLRVTVRHATASRQTTDSVLVVACRSGHVGLGEGCPRSYVTGETAEGAVEWLNRMLPELSRWVATLDDLRRWNLEHKVAIDENPAAWTAAETACLDLLAREADCSVEALLALDDGPMTFRYSAVLATETGEALRGMAGRYLKVGMTDFKIRPTGGAEDGDATSDRARLGLLREMAREMGLPPLRIRMDGNNLWRGKEEACLKYLEELGAGVGAPHAGEGRPAGEPLFALEEPLAPGDYAGLVRISRRFSLPVILDESAQTPEDLELAATAAGNGSAQGASPWMVNLKVAKVGGILRALTLAEEVRARGWPLVLGAHVGETSILTRAAQVVARVMGSMVVAQEGAFGTLLLEHDAVEPSLSFGARGELTWPGPEAHRPTGLGLQLTHYTKDELIS